MKQEITFSMFCDAFGGSYNNNFSYDGKKALFDYLEQYEEDTEDQIELDIIALCCEYTEYSDVSDYLNNYQTDIEKKDYEDVGEFDAEEYEKAVIEEIQDKTTFIGIKDTDGFIIQSY